MYNKVILFLILLTLDYTWFLEAWSLHEGYKVLVKVVILPELKLGNENSISCSRKSVNKIELFHGTMLTQISNSIEVKVNVCRPSSWLQAQFRKREFMFSDIVILLRFHISLNSSPSLDKIFVHFHIDWLIDWNDKIWKFWLH